MEDQYFEFGSFKAKKGTFSSVEPADRNFLKDTGKAFASGAMNRVAGLADFGKAVGEQYRTTDEKYQMNEDLKLLGQAADQMRSKAKEIHPNRNSNKSFIDEFKQGDPIEAGRKLSLAIAENLPQYAGMAASIYTGNPNASLELIGASAVGNSYNENEDMPDQKRRAVALGKGASEVVFEKVTSMKYLDDLMNSPGVKKGIYEGFKQVALNAGIEAAGEAATETTNNTIDILANNRDKNGNLPSIFRGVPESLVLGGVMGSGATTLGQTFNNTRQTNESFNEGPNQVLIPDEVIIEDGYVQPKFIEKGSRSKLNKSERSRSYFVDSQQQIENQQQTDKQFLVSDTQQLINNQEVDSQAQGDQNAPQANLEPMNYSRENQQQNLVPQLQSMNYLQMGRPETTPMNDLTLFRGEMRNINGEESNNNLVDQKSTEEVLGIEGNKVDIYQNKVDETKQELEKYQDIHNQAVKDRDYSEALESEKAMERLKPKLNSFKEKLEQAQEEARIKNQERETAKNNDFLYLTSQRETAKNYANSGEQAQEFDSAFNNIENVEPNIRKFSANFENIIDLRNIGDGEGVIHSFEQVDQVLNKLGIPESKWGEIEQQVQDRHELGRQPIGIYNMFRSGVLEKINPYLSENIEAIRYNEGKQDNFIVLNKNTLQEQQLAPDLQPMNYFREDQQQEINQGDRIKFNPGPESNFDEEITGQVVSSYNKGEVEFITDDQDMKRVKLDNGEISKIKETVGEDLPIDISFNDFDFELARRAYDGSSFSPKKRASYDINRYLTHMQNVYNELEGLAKTKKQKSILKMELERYKKNYLDKLSSLLSSKARTASQFVTGPAKFDHRKNNKRMGTVDKKREGFLNWQDKALKAMKRKLKKSRSDKQVTNEEFESLKKDINSSMVSIAKVMNGQSPGMNKDAFKNSIIGKIKRRAKNGKVELVEKALEHLEKKQNELLPRNTITKRHSVWNALETAKSVAKKQNKSGVETIKEYESVEIVNDHGANRVRILFNEKPSKEVRNELKGSGWNWSPSVGAWQRKNTNAAKQNSKYIIDKFFEESNEIDESQEKTKEEISRKQNNTIDSLFDSAMGAVGKGEASWDNIEIFKAKNEPVVRFKMNKEDGTDITTTNKRSSDGSVYIDKKGNIIDIEKNPTVKENDYVKVEQKDIIREKSNKTETTRKLPQEITLDEFLKRNSEAGLGKEHHRANVRRALEAGEQVPQEVLNDYPELQEKQGQETGNQKIETLTESATPKSQLFPTAIRLPNNEYVNIEYAVVEADNLIASHDSNLNKNENYLQDLQPRAREREASLSQIENIKNEFDPLSVMTSRSADGSPIISPDGMVEIGNGRTIAIKDMYKNNAETIQEYKDILIDEAGNLGLNQEQIEQADNPVLVRKRTDDMSLKEREQYVIEANKSDNADQSSTEMAMNDAKQMSSQLLSKYNSQSGINTLKNQDFVSNFLDDVVGEAGKGKYLDESGTISQDGLKRIENAIFAKVYGDLNAIKKLSERVDAKMKNVTGAMLNVAPDYLKMQESIKDGNLYDLDIAEDIADTFKLYEEAKKIGNPIEDFINQQKMFGPDTTALQEELIKMFERNKYSKKKMTEILGSYVDAVKEAGNPKQQTMFGKREAPNKKEVLEAAIKVAEEGENDQQQAFFAEKEQTVGSKNASTKSKTQAEKVQQQIKELQEKIKTETKDNKLDKFNNKLEALKKQLIKLHKGEGGYIDFGSLFGDNKEIEDVTDLFEQVRRKEKFEAGKDDWFGAKDLAEVEHSIEALQLEDKLKESLHGDLTANDINTAIQVSIDLKYTAATTNKTVQETIDKYYDQLSEEKQKYVDLSQNLTKEQQQIEEEILESDKTMGDKAKRAGVINNIVDYHLTRKWESDSKLDSQIEKKFGTKSALRKQRTLESILEGWAKGKELEIQGATKALQASKNNLVRTIEDKALVETLEKENVMKPEHKVTKEDLENGWEAIQHPNFREWKAVDNVELGKEIKIDSTDQADDFSIDDKVIAQDGKKEGEIGRIEVENRLNNVTVRFKDGGSYRYHLNDLKKIRPGGPNTFIADDGTVFERVDFYAPPGVAENLDNILSTPEKNDFRALAQARKQLILQSSFFHHLAYMRSFGLATDTSLFEALTTKNPIKMMNQGMELLKTMDSELELLISQGLTIGRVQDFDLKNYRGGDKDSKFWRLALGREGGFRQKHSDFLFKKMGAGLKAKAALMEYKYMLRKNPELAQSLKGRKKLAKNVAKLINQDFGGLHFERMGMSPKTEGTLDLIFLAKDWTLSNGLMVYNALPKWARKTIKSIGYPFKKGAASYRGEEVQKAVDPTEVKQALDNYLQQDDLSQEEKMKAEHTRKYFQEKIEDQQRQTKLSRHALFNVAIKSSVLSLMMNFAMAGLDSLDDDEFEPLRMYAKRFKSIKSTMSPAKKWQTMFDNLINSVALDITPIFEMAGIDTDNSRKYFSIAGHFEDPLELVANTAQFLKYKGSALTQISLDAITGTNWQGKAYTTYKEFLGTDDKGNYKTTNLKEGYVKGQNKGGKDQFKLTKWGFAPDTTTFDQAPSFIMSEALGSTPIQVQNAARLMMGESDWLEMTLESAGIGVRQVRKDNN